MRRGASLPRAWPGPGEGDKALAGVFGKSAVGGGGAGSLPEGRADSGAGGRGWGFAPSPASPSPSSDFVTPFRLLSQASCRKETPRASPALQEAPTPPWGAGLIGRRPAPPLTPGRLPSIRSRTLPSRELKGTRRHLSKEIQLPL